jgi:8-oxo-dGTP pyrophosphatase MutT (NUDIX family)
MTIQKVEAKHVEAAGILFFARSSGNFLLVYRSANVVDPSCWCGAGGKIEEGESPEDAARREIDEELGFDTYEEDGTYVSLYVHRSEGLTFYNFLGILDEQFYPKLNWEADGYVWAPLKDLPKPFHYGFQEILDDSRAMKIIDALCVPAGTMEPEEELLRANSIGWGLDRGRPAGRSAPFNNKTGQLSMVGAGSQPFHYLKEHAMSIKPVQLVTSSSDAEIIELSEKVKKQAEKMESYAKKNGRTTKEYENMQREMQKLRKQQERLDPDGKKTPFHYLVWNHGGKPARKFKPLFPPATTRPDQ